MKKVLTMFLLFAMMLSMTSCDTLFDLFNHWGLHNCYDINGNGICDGCLSPIIVVPTEIKFSAEEGSGTLEDPFIVYADRNAENDREASIACIVKPDTAINYTTQWNRGYISEKEDGTLEFIIDEKNTDVQGYFDERSVLFVVNRNAEDTFLKLTIEGTTLEYYFFVDVIGEESINIPMAGIVLDESTMLDGEGTLAQPYYLWLTHGEEFDIYYSLLPEDATDASFTWTFGTFLETPGAYEFIQLENGAAPGFTMTDGTGGGITVSAGDTSGTWMVKGTANDGGGLEIYFIIGVEAPMTE